MLLELNFHWNASEFAEDPVTGQIVSSTYNLQVGSLIQVIAVKKETTFGTDFQDPSGQFGEAYAVTTDEETAAAPYPNTDPPTNVPGDKDVYLANSTPDGTDIAYTGHLQYKNGRYGLYTQIYIDEDIYDRVYIRVFGATDIAEGTVTASYWGVGTTNDIYTLNPTFQFDTYEVENREATTATYFEVIPEPATLGLLGLGACALATWRRRRSQEDKR